MANWRFGVDETITCIQNVDFTGPEGEALCLAYKISIRHVGAPIYLTDDGYVLKVVKDNSYFPLPQERVAALQQSGALPTPLTAYAIPTSQYVVVYLIWILFAGMGALALFKRSRARRRQEDDAMTPISVTPPTIERKGDRFIVEQMAPQLGSGEAITHQGYAVSERVQSMGSAMGADAFFVALTTKRLLVIEARVGAFGPLFENRGLTAIDRTAIVSAVRDDQMVTIRCGNGRVVTLFVDLTKTKHFSNQATLLRDLARVLDPTGAGGALVPAAGYIRPA
jgi:hypothetical protein